MTFDEEFENVKNIVGMCLKSLVGHRAQEYRAVLGRAPEAGLFRPRIWLVWNTFKTMLVQVDGMKKYKKLEGEIERKEVNYVQDLKKQILNEVERRKRDEEEKSKKDEEQKRNAKAKDKVSKLPPIREDTVKLDFQKMPPKIRMPDVVSQSSGETPEIYSQPESQSIDVFLIMKRILQEKGLSTDDIPAME